MTEHDEAKEWAEQFEAYKKEMSEKGGDRFAEVKTVMLPEPIYYLEAGSLRSRFKDEQQEQEVMKEVQRGQQELLAYDAASFLRPPLLRSWTNLLSLPYEGGVEDERGPGLHLTRAESHESSLRMRDYFDEHTTEEFFDMWMTREGVS